MFDWLRENWIGIYIIGVFIAGPLAMLATFVGLWWFAATKYELGGLVLGWIPGAVAALVAFFVVGFGWPVVVPLIWWLGSLALDHRQPAY